MRIHISASLEHDYENRVPDHIPEKFFEKGYHDVTPAELKVLYEDAKFNAEVPDEMPAYAKRAYKSLLKQCEKLMGK